MLNLKLKAFRVNEGLSVYDMAERLKVSKSTISRWEREENKIPHKMFERYCQICHIDEETKQILSQNNVKKTGGKHNETRL